MKNQKKAKIAVFVIFLLITAFITILMVPVAVSLRTEEGRDAIAQRVSSFGAFAPFAFVLLQILQVIIALVPGEPVEIMGGVLFGAFGGLALCSLGSLLGSVCVYYAVKRFGKPLVDMFVSAEKLEKFKILNNEKRLETAVFLLFLLPGTPKDALTYFVPLTKLAPAKFFALSTIARIPSVITSTMMGDSLSEGNWLGSVLVFAVTCTIIIIGMLIKSHLSTRRKKAESDKSDENM